jgi:SPP1 family predicted phage head-tail adaptor
MRAGKLRHLLAIQRYNPTTSTVSGETIAGYLEGEKVWGEIIPLGGREFQNAQQIVGDDKYQITIRYTRKIGRKDRLCWDGQTFEVESLSDPEMRHIELVLTCHEIVTSDGPGT